MERQNHKSNILGKVDAPSVIAIIAILGFIWGMFASFKSDIRAEITNIKGEVNRGFDAIDKRFNAVDERFNEVDERFDNIENRLVDLEEQIKTHKHNNKKTRRKVQSLKSTRNIASDKKTYKV